MGSGGEHPAPPTDGASRKICGVSDGAWLSLVERLVRDQEVVGSNPTAPILFDSSGRVGA